MIAKLFHADQETVVLHEDLKTTFTGVVHPVSTSDAIVHQYRGIKYANVPARFRQSRLCTTYPPQTDATRYGPICPQPHCKGAEEELFGIARDAVLHQVLKQNEFECLNLNITCPADATPESQLPVMLWTHGGKSHGSGSSWLCDGGALVQKSMQIGMPVILVTFNYRLGLLGFAASPALREDNRAVGDEGVGNYGLRDQRRALEWVHNFIAPFGGDPSNITLCGSAHGAADILCHMRSAANETHPLFARAIVQSALVDANVPSANATGYYLSRVMAALRVQSVEDLREVDVSRLVEKTAAGGWSVRAVDDGCFFESTWTGSLVPDEDEHPHHHQHGGVHGAHHHLSGHPHVEEESLLAQVQGRPHHRHSPYTHAHSHSRSRSRVRGASSAAVSSAPRHSSQRQPLMIGDCGFESSLFASPASLWTSTGAVKRIRAICQSLTKSNALLRAYDINPYSPSDELSERLLELINDARVAWPTERVVRSARRERGGRGVWRYVFDQEAPGKGVPHHAVDLLYLFDTVPVTVSAPTYPMMDEGIPEFFYGADSDDEDEDEIRTDQGVRSVSPCRELTKFDDSSVDDIRFNIDFDELDHDTDEASASSDRSGRFSPPTYDPSWALAPPVSEQTYQRIRTTVLERWLTFAYGGAPWSDDGDKVYVFGPEGEVGERSAAVLESRRRRSVWREVLEPVGMALVQKVGAELGAGPGGACVRPGACRC